MGDVGRPFAAHKRHRHQCRSRLGPNTPPARSHSPCRLRACTQLARERVTGTELGRMKIVHRLNEKIERGLCLLRRVVAYRALIAGRARSGRPHPQPAYHTMDFIMPNEVVKAMLPADEPARA